VPAVEVMLATARIRELIMEKATTRTITENIAKGFVAYGMQTFDQSLMNLLQGGLITYEEALNQCSNPDDFALRVSGVASSENDAAWQDFEPKKSAKGNNDFNLDEFDIERF
jgi:twitching motility protein PilT